MRVRREGLGPDRSIPGDTCTERVYGVFGCSRESSVWKVSEITTSSDGFSDTIDVGVIALEDHEHVQRDVRAKTRNMLT